MIELKKIWNELTAAYSHQANLSENLWNEIETQYTSTNRYYHNLSHLAYMINHAIACKNQLKDWDTLLFSIFYHDIVYKTTRQDNEQQSAELAAKRLAELAVPTLQITKCQQQILATKTHISTKDQDTSYLLDFDLAILGEPFEAYQIYTRNIRKEYAIYPDFLYKKGRRKVLLHFLEKEEIYKTPMFHSQLEQQARVNIEHELITL